MKKYLIPTLLCLGILTITTVSQAGSSKLKDDGSLATNIRLGNGMTITSIYHPLKEFDPQEPLEPQILTRGNQYQYPTVPLAGFSPYVAIALSNKREYDELAFEHNLEYKYTGSPLTSNQNYPDMPFTIGILDSGSEVDILAGSATDLLGLNGQYLTENYLPIGGIGEDFVNTVISEPLGLYVTGINNIQPGNHIDPNDFVGHSNNAMLAAPAIECHDQETVTGLVGRSLIGFYTTVIRNDQRKTVTVEGREYSGPSVEFLPRNSTNIPPYSKQIGLTVADSSTASATIATTAAFYRLYFPELGLDEMFPTMLAMSSAFYPTGATFAIEVEITQSGRTRILNFILDTGAQTSIINSTTASRLGLPLEGDFSVEVCGVSGSINNVPGYYLDQLDIYGLGGALSYSHVPFILADFGTAFDGILGMNVFYDRNITLAPDISLTGSSCKLYVSDPVDFADADFNDDNRVNLIDFADFAKSWLSNFGDPNYNIKHDLFLSDSIDITDLEIFTQKWLEQN